MELFELSLPPEPAELAWAQSLETQVQQAGYLPSPAELARHQQVLESLIASRAVFPALSVAEIQALSALCEQLQAGRALSPAQQQHWREGLAQLIWETRQAWQALLKTVPISSYVPSSEDLDWARQIWEQVQAGEALTAEQSERLLWILKAGHDVR